MKTNGLLLLFLLGNLLSIFPGFASEGNRLETLNDQLKLAKKDSNRVNLLNEMGIELRNDDPTKAIEYTKEAMELAMAIGFQRGLARSYNNYGGIEFLIGKYDEALAYCFKSIKLSEESGNKNELANSYSYIGRVKGTQGNYVESINYYLKCLDLYEKTGNKYGMAKTNMNIGVVYFDMYFDKKQDSTALSFQKKSLAEYEELHDNKGIALCYINIGEMYQKLNHFSEALDYYKKSTVILKELNEKRATALTYNNIGQILTDQSHYKESESNLIKSLKIRQEIDDKLGMAETYLNIGILNAAQQRFEQAIDYYKKSLLLAQQTGAKEYLKEAYEAMSGAYSQTGNFQQAFVYSKLLLNIKDSLQNEKSSKQIAEMQTKYETERKASQIILLMKEKELNAKEAYKQELIKYSLMGLSALFVLVILLVLNRFYLKHKANRVLEEKNLEIISQKNKIEHQRDLLLEKNTQITDSIEYAKRIQKALLPRHSLLNNYFQDSFILFKPKDVVSGDFFWIQETEEHIYCAAVDCTGHGVPGALMSIVGFNLLEQAVNIKKLIDPASILNELSISLANKLKQNDQEDIHDGMDIALCAIEKKTNKLLFAGVNLGMYIISQDTLIELKLTRIIKTPFTGQFQNQEMALKKGDLLYLFTDGFIDQHGGLKKKKFYADPFKKLLIDHKDRNLNSQKEELEKTINSWKGNLEQTDDMCVIGMQI